MSLNSICDLSESKEHSFPILVKLCSKAYLAEVLTRILYSDSEYIHWSISIPPDYIINNRGRKVPYKLAKPQQQFNHLNYLITHYQWPEELKDMYIVYEYTKLGVIHLHALTSNTLNLQLMKASFVECLDFNIKKFDDKLNLNFKPVYNKYKIIAYFLKDPIDYVSNKNEMTIDDFNTSIINKKYEKSDFTCYYI